MFKIPSITAATSTVWSTPSTTGILASLSEKLYSRTLQDSLASHTISIHAGKNNTILHLASLDQPTVLVTSGGTVMWSCEFYILVWFEKGGEGDY
jgi:hypothetical protein